MQASSCSAVLPWTSGWELIISRTCMLVSSAVLECGTGSNGGTRPSFRLSSGGDGANGRDRRLHLLFRVADGGRQADVLRGIGSNGSHDATLTQGPHRSVRVGTIDIERNDARRQLRSEGRVERHAGRRRQPLLELTCQRMGALGYPGLADSGVEGEGFRQRPQVL